MVNRRSFLLRLLISAIAIVLLQTSAAPARESHYTITGRSPFNQPAFYPIAQRPAAVYKPIANWVGRLMLPPQSDGADWVWLEVAVAPDAAKDTIGKTVRLEWSPEPGVQAFVQAVTRDVNFTSEVEASRREGNIHPDRLNHRAQVGPLQSIAGARPSDDAIVTLDQATLIRRADGAIVLQTATEPTLAIGRYYGLVKLISPSPDAPRPADCPGGPPCPSDVFQVRHYNPQTQQFDGAADLVRIPQQPRDGFGVFASTSRDLEKSAVGQAGWYIYGAPDKDRLFTVQALKPRSLVQLQPQQVLLGQAAGLDHLNYDNWKNTETRGGTLESVLVDPVAKDKGAAIAAWKAGDRALVMHLFGGRGGRSGEPPALGTVTGHFAYGLAEVIRDRFTQELQLDLNYEQIYAKNIEGIIAGRNSWANYMGSLQRGWMGTRPVADILVKLDEITQDYSLGGTIVAPLAEFQRQLTLIAARYRIGDGSGGAVVTPATSCVQDSNQALFATLQTIRRRIESDPATQNWLTTHPTDPTTQRFLRLIALADDLDRQLSPFGIVRGDWNQNANVLSGTRSPQGFIRPDSTPVNLLSALVSWRTILPRQAQDELSILFLRHNAQLWFLRTNQIGGVNPEISPIAPTPAFGRWRVGDVPVISVLFTRILGGLNLPSGRDWLITIGILAVYSGVALAIGFPTGFLQLKVWAVPRRDYLFTALRLFLSPALLEEFIFRVLLLPYPRAGVTGERWIFWAIVSLILFILYHPFNAKTFYKPGFPTFFDPRFLTLTGLLGLACTIAYGLTGSLLAIAVIHWAVVTVWLLLFGGLQKLQGVSRGDRPKDNYRVETPND